MNNSDILEHLFASFFANVTPDQLSNAERQLTTTHVRRPHEMLHWTSLLFPRADDRPSPALHDVQTHPTDTPLQTLPVIMMREILPGQRRGRTHRTGEHLNVVFSDGNNGQGGEQHYNMASASPMVNELIAQHLLTNEARILEDSLYHSHAPQPAPMVDRANIFVYVADKEDLDKTCSISQDNFVAGDRISRWPGCGHVFKTDSLDEWLQRSAVCPNCRRGLKR